MTLSNIMLSLAAALALTIAVAEARPHHPPPAQAFEACASKTAGDACRFTHREHTIDGTCVMPPDIDELVCAPAHPPEPPPEAVRACADRREGDACSFEHRARRLEGTCRFGLDGAGPLACAPT